MSLATWLATQEGRCSSCGYHLQTQKCRCGGDEWSVFTRALRQAANDLGTIHQRDVRKLIKGRIEPKHIGLAWKRARDCGLVVVIGHEQSDDTAGRNSHRLEPVYELTRR